jgi:putative endonuclease
MQNNQWWVYMVRCADNSLYTGITTDLPRRLAEHNQEAGPAKKGAAARYTRSRRPVTLVYQEAAGSRAEAARREAAIKRLPKPAKEHLILDPCANSSRP